MALVELPTLPTERLPFYYPEKGQNEWFWPRAGQGYSLSEYPPEGKFFLARKVFPFLPKNEKVLG